MYIHRYILSSVTSSFKIDEKHQIRCIAMRVLDEVYERENGDLYVFWDYEQEINGYQGWYVCLQILAVNWFEEKSLTHSMNKNFYGIDNSM